MERKTMLSPLAALLLYIAIYAAVVIVVAPLARVLAAPFFDQSTVHGIMIFRGVSAIFFGWLNLAFAVLVLRLRGQTLSEIGWGRRGAIWGWLLALAIVGLYIGTSFHAFDPKHAKAYALDPGLWLSDWSLFRIGLALGLGLTAGICEETIFRGFVMSQARDAGAPVAVQIALSGLLFGLAHFSLGEMNGHIDIATTLGVVASTAVFGIAFAIVYVLAKRSLLPGIVGHTIFAATFEPFMVMAVIAASFPHLAR